MKNDLVARRRPNIVTDFAQMLRVCDEVFGDKPLFTYKENGEIINITYHQQHEYVLRLCAAFRELGLAGKHIAVIGDANPYYMIAYYASVICGGVIVPLDKELPDEEIINFLNFSDSSAVVFTGSFNRRIPKFADQLNTCKTFIPIQPDDNTAGIETTMQSLLDIGKKLISEGKYTSFPPQNNLKNLAVIIFTSGTTGTSKGVMLSQANIVAAINSSSLSMEYDDRNTFVSVLPFNHAYEMTCGQLALANLGGSVYLNDSLKNVMRSFSYYKPNALILVPLFVETIYKRIWGEIAKKNMTAKVIVAMRASVALLKLGIDKREELFAPILAPFGGNLKSIVCGGAPIDPQLLKDFHSFGITVLEGYGITECAPLIAVNRPGKIRYHSVGQPVNGCTVKIDKTPGMRTGEILVKGDNVMLGYYKNEEATRDAFTEDGWFKTGDIGYIDRDNYIYITGRKKNVIILSNGKNIFPEEIEYYLARCPLIAESIVVGRANENKDVVITALIYPNKDAPELAGKNQDEIHDILKEAVNQINKNLPTFKQIREIEIRGTEFEKTTSKKIKRYLYFLNK